MIEVIIALTPTLVLFVLFLLIVKGGDKVSFFAAYLYGTIADIFTLSLISLYLRNVKMYRYLRGY